MAEQAGQVEQAEQAEQSESPRPKLNKHAQSEQSLQLQQRFVEAFEAGAGDPVRRKIIWHAVDVFSRKGYAGTKIKDIAASAGFSQGYVYSYYKSKEELFVKIVELASDGAGGSVYWASRLPGTPLERLIWLTEAYLSPDSVAQQHWRFNLLMAIASEGIPEQALAVARQRRDEPFKHLIPLIVEGQQLGEILDDNSLTLAITYFSILQGLGIARIQAGGEAEQVFPTAEVVLRFMTAAGAGKSR